MRPENLKNDTKFDELIKNNQTSCWVWDFASETFGRYWCCYMSVPIFIHVRET